MEVSKHTWGPHSSQDSSIRLVPRSKLETNESKEISEQEDEAGVLAVLMEVELEWLHRPPITVNMHRLLKAG